MRDAMTWPQLPRQLERRPHDRADRQTDKDPFIACEAPGEWERVLFPNGDE